jgi:uncharacterized membrane protein
MTELFTVSKTLRFGWQTVRDRLGFFLAIVAISVGVSLLPAGIQKFLEDGDPTFAFLAIIPAWVLGMVVQMGLILIPLRICDGEDPELSDLFSCYDLVPRYILASIAYMLLVSVGLLLLVVPGILWGIKYQFFGYHIVDEDAGALDSLRRSAEITQGAKGKLGWLFLALLGLNVAGFVCLLLGLLLTYAVTLVCCAFVYRRLCDHTPGDGGIAQS